MKNTAEAIREIFNNGRSFEKNFLGSKPRTLDSISVKVLRGFIGGHSPQEDMEIGEHPVMARIREMFAKPRHDVKV